MAQNLVINGVTYNGVESLSIPKSGGGKAEFVDAKAVATNTKTYEITLTKASGWVLLTTLDDEVISHINDNSLIVSLVNITPYTYEQYTVSTAIATNNPWGYTNGYATYGYAGVVATETTSTMSGIYYPANKTDTSTGIGGNGVFRISGKQYYFRPGNYFVRSGTYRLTFTW